MKLRHNTQMRILTGAVLLVAVPGLMLLAVAPWAGWAWACAAPALWLGLMVYGFFFGWRHIVVRQCTCASPLLPPEFDGYRIVQLADLHLGTLYRNPSFVDKMVAMTNAQRPDMIAFTGDLVNISASEVLPFRRALGRLRAADGVYSVMGNHDYCEYGEDTSEENIRKNQRVLRHLQRKMGWRLLMNEHAIINRGAASIAVAGVENISRPPFQDYGDLGRALAGLPPGMFKVLLSHDPSHWRRGVLGQTDVALTLSGHTHAGQLRVGRFSPAKWAYKEWGGRYVERGSMLHVSLGLGGTVPFRLGAWPEINVITLRCK